ncbi:MAG: cofactor-independent phosphoglycerate mutase [Thermoplasmata archaeon]|nr:MAG: cofactor-independent phosphoglycerate mutase [Thermoplasmata archaeon]
MKYAIIIPDGAADLPIEELDDLTPLAVAETPNMDWIAAEGKCGTVRTIPPKMPHGSDVAIMSVMGYDPRQYYTGRAPLEAAARGIEVGTDQWVFRCNLVTIVDGIMEDYSAGHISTVEAKILIDKLNNLLVGGQGDSVRLAGTMRFYPGVSYRHLLIVPARSGRGLWKDVKTTPPHDIIGKPIENYLPRGPGSEVLVRLIEQSEDILSSDDVNQVRRDLGENPATHIWLWGQGKMPKLPPFIKQYGIKSSASIAAVDLVRGLSKLIGWEHIEVPGATGYLDTNYAGKGEAAVAALENHDLVFVHIEAPDEAGHNGDISGKVRAIEQIDQHIVGPILKHLQNLDDDWRIMVLPDHPTPCSIRSHTSEPVPFAIAGTRIASVAKRHFTEADAEQSDLHVELGFELMEYFLKVR